MSQDLYHEQLLELAEDRSFSHPLEQPDIVLHGHNASCGDEVTLYIALEDKNDPLSSIKVVTHTNNGCIISRAATAAVIHKINQEHLSLAAAQHITQKEIEKMLGLEDISVGRVKCLMLAVSTLNSRKVWPFLSVQLTPLKLTQCV